jgi:hypothetical protein
MHCGLVFCASYLRGALTDVRSRTGRKSSDYLILSESCEQYAWDADTSSKVHNMPVAAACRGCIGSEHDRESLAGQNCTRSYAIDAAWIEE